MNTLRFFLLLFSFFVFAILIQTKSYRKEKQEVLPEHIVLEQTLTPTPFLDVKKHR